MPKPAPPLVEIRYPVQPGDSLWTIARRVYGDARQWRRLEEANHGRIADPLRLRAGEFLLVPPPGL